MALNSNFVINRIGFTPGESGPDRPTPGSPGDLDASYTSSRLGLTFVRQDQPPAMQDKAPRTTPIAPDNGETLSARLGISPETKPGNVARPFWSRFIHAPAALTGAVRKLFSRKRKPQRDKTARIEETHDFKSHPVENPAPKPASNEPPTAYRKGTYKLPAELISRLRTCAKTNHEYQYKLVTESLDEFLTAKGFAHDQEIDSP